MSEAKTVTVSAKFKSEAFLKRITSAAQAAQSSMPTEKELAGADEATKGLYNRMTGFLQSVLSTSEWTDERLISAAKEAGWMQTSVQLAASAHTSRTRGFIKPANSKGGGGGGGPTSPADCSNGYSTCLKENDCDGGFVCICCLPCSLQYWGCMKKVVFGAQAPIATIIDLTGTWASGGVPGPIISVTGNSISVDMSSYKRPLASGYITDSSDIIVNFPDDRAYTAKLQAPNTIFWSNDSAWTKV
jgi:hypothetical protein